MLDDLPQIISSAELFIFFSDFIDLLLRSNSKLITTGNSALTSKLKGFTKIDHIYDFRLKLLDTFEIREFVLEFCSSVDNIENVSEYIYNLSDGHPSIVGAACEYLDTRGWVLTEREKNELLNGTYKSALEEETYQKITESIPDVSSKYLLYRLRMIIGRISNSEIDLICEAPPPIDLPYEKLAVLSGMWVTQPENSMYELSPLVKRIPNDNLPPSLRKSLNEALGRQIIDKGQIDEIEAYKAFLYFQRAENYNLAGFVLVLTLEAALKNPEAIFDLPLLLFWTDRPLPNKMDVHLKTVIRSLQIGVIRARQDWTKELFLDYLLTDLEAIVGKSLQHGVNVSYSALFLADFFSQTNSHKSNKYLLLAIRHLDQITSTDLKSFVESQQFSVENLIWKNLVAVATPQQFDNWIATYDALGSEHQSKALRGEMQLICIQLFFRNLYDLEKLKPEASWKDFVDFIDHILLKVVKFEISSISTLCIKYKIRILIDQFSDFDTACKIANEFLESFAEASVDEFIVMDEIGQQLYYGGFPAMSKEYLVSAAMIETPKYFTEKAECWLILNQIYDEIDKDIAHSYVKLAYEFQLDNGYLNEVFSYKVIGEYAWSMWELYQGNEPYYIIESGLKRILSSYQAEGEYQAVIVRYSHVLNYMYHINSNRVLPTPGGEEYSKPFRGIFLRSNEPLLAGGFYFEQRKYMVACLMVQVFELIGDRSAASYWVHMCRELNREERFNPFVILMMGMHTYYILDHEFDEATFFQVEVLNQIDSLSADSANEISILSDQTRSILTSFSIEGIDDHDIYLQKFVSIYILIRIFWDYILETDSLDINIKKYEDTWNYYSDTSSLEKIRTVLELLNTSKTSTEEICNLASEFKEETHIYISSLLAASIKSSAKEALVFHLAIIRGIEFPFNTFASSSLSRLLVTPFFIDFWKKKFNDHTNEFLYQDFLQNKGFPSILSSKSEKQLKVLFHVLCHHLDVEPDAGVYKWMESV